MVASHPEKDKLFGGVKTLNLQGGAAKRFIHEWSQIKLQSNKFPTVSQLREWKTDLYATVNTASRRTDKGAVQWLQEVDKEYATFEYLRESGEEFMTLDNKLGIALIGFLPVSLRRKIKRLQESEQINH